VISRARRGDDVAWGALVGAHQAALFRLAYLLLGDADAAADVAQDAFVRAFRSFAQFRGGSPRAWLFAIVRNCCRSAQSGRAGVLALVIHESGLSDDAAQMLNEQADPAPTPEEEVIRRTEINRLRLAIEAMPEPFREAVVLRDIEELSYAEVAEVTGVPIGTVMSRLSRGRSILAKELLPAAKDNDDASRSVK